VGFRQSDQEVEVFSAQHTDYPFTEAVSLGASRWCPEYAQPHVRNELVELGREIAIATVNEKTVAMA